jgi:ankyrin repeat protein
MRIRHTLAVSIGFKVGIVLLCVSLVWAQRLLGADYFNTALSEGRMRQAVQEAENVDAYNQFGYTGLMTAASEGRLPLAKALVKNGAHLNLKSRKGTYVGIANKITGLTALQLGVNNLRIPGSKQVAYYLIDVFADARMADEQGNTALHLIISTDTVPDRTAMAQALIKNGAQMNAQNFQGDALIHLAVNLRDRFWIESLAKNFGPLINFELKNKKGLTPYEYALRLGFGDVADALKALKIEMPGAAEYNPIGLTGLMLATIKGGQKMITQMASQTKALNLKSQDNYKNSALHLVLLFGNIKGLETLLDKGASPRIKNAQGYIPLQFVPRMPDPAQRIAAAQILLKKAPESMLAQNNKGENLIHTIVRLNDQQLLDGLIKQYPSRVRQAVLAKNKKLQSPLQLASQMRRKEIATRLQAIRKDVLSNKK